MSDKDKVYNNYTDGEMKPQWTGRSKSEMGTIRDIQEFQVLL